MSFRRRLTLFFVLIVLAPMGVLAGAWLTIVARAQDNARDVRLNQATSTAKQAYALEQTRASEAAGAIGADEELGRAIRAGERGPIEQRLEELRQLQRVFAVRLALDGKAPIEHGSPDTALASARRPLRDRGKPIGELVVAGVSSSGYATEAARLTGMKVLISDERGRPLAAEPDGLRGLDLPQSGERTIGSERHSIQTFGATTADGGGVTVRLLAPESVFGDDVPDASAAAGIALLSFLLLALAFALLLSRSLQAQVSELLQAARRLGAGELDVTVPTAGNDEFAQLGSEFNAMARQLKARLEELQHERTRLREAIRRVGESFATGLDRDALLGIAVETAVDGLAAGYGRAAVTDGQDGAVHEVASAGRPDPGLVAQVDAALAACLRDGLPADAPGDGVAALAHPLRTEPRGPLLGVLALARCGRPFSHDERDLFAYLALQAGVSIENAQLHEAVQRQAVTDELTGLFNHRRFQEVLATEVERTRRFGADLSLVMLDLDNFKRVNDTYGHRQGDEVLRRVAAVLRQSAREIDLPARYGGEELAAILPQTHAEGAHQFAERMRGRIEALELPLLEGEGMLRVTASFGVATLTGAEAAADKDALVAAADAALYRAKRAGKNRVVAAAKSRGVRRDR